MTSSTPITPRLKPASSERIGGGPGDMLRQARERQSISLDQVANQLKLSVKMVTALENDDYSHINSLIFLKGYLKNYAKVVNLPADDLLARIDTRQFEQNKQRPPTIEYEVHYFTRDQVVRWLTLGLGVLLVTLMLSWWHSHSGDLQMPLLPGSHTAPNLPAQTQFGPGAESDVPIYEDSDLSSGEAVEEVTPTPTVAPDKVPPIESYSDNGEERWGYVPQGRQHG